MGLPSFGPFRPEGDIRLALGHGAALLTALVLMPIPFMIVFENRIANPTSLIGAGLVSSLGLYIANRVGLKVIGKANP